MHKLTVQMLCARLFSCPLECALSVYTILTMISISPNYGMFCGLARNCCTRRRFAGLTLLLSSRFMLLRLAATRLHACAGLLTVGCHVATIVGIIKTGTLFLENARFSCRNQANSDKTGEVLSDLMHFKVSLRAIAAIMAL